jgi:hypothetical protein
MGIDVQENHFWVVIRTWAADGESWMLWSGKVLTEQELIEKQQEFMVHGSCVGVDMAHWPNRVAQMIVRNNWRGLWGSDKQYFMHPLPTGGKVTKIISPMYLRDPYLGTVHASDQNERARWVYICSDPLNSMLEDLRQGDPEDCKFHVLSTCHPDYVQQMNAVVCLEREVRQNGKRINYWKQIRQDDHMRDAEKFCLALAIIKNIIKDTEIPGATQPVKKPAIPETEPELVPV